MSGCRIKVTDPLVVAVRPYRGPALEVGQAFEHVLSWADVYHLEQWGPLIGVYDDVPADPAGIASTKGEVDPGVTDSDEGVAIAAEAWLPLPPGTRPPAGDDDVEVRSLPSERVALCLHRGYPDGVGEALAGLLGWIAEQGLVRASGSHRQVYVRAPKGRPSEWEIEVQVPVVSDRAETSPSERRRQ